MHDASTLRRITSTSPAPDEAALVEAARDTPMAFGVLYHRYLNRIYAYVRARSANAEDAADLTQQVFLRALDALPSFRGTRDGAFAAWLFRIARNVAADYHRRHHGTIAWDLVLSQAGSFDSTGLRLVRWAGGSRGNRGTSQLWSHGKVRRLRSGRDCGKSNFLA